MYLMPFVLAAQINISSSSLVSKEVVREEQRRMHGSMKPCITRLPEDFQKVMQNG